VPDPTGILPVASVASEIGRALSFAFGMLWEILWALILGFFLSGVVQSVVSKRAMTRLLPDARPRSLLVATGLGAASSSCSYASVALARSIFRKGADFTAAMAFEFASTNLVIELGVILALLMGWQFTLGEFIGGPLMIVFIALLFRVFLKKHMVEKARLQADRGLLGLMEGHAEMDMSVTEGGSIWRRMTSPKGFTAISHSFVMDWAAVWRPGYRRASGRASSSSTTRSSRRSGGRSWGRSWRSSLSSARSATCPWQPCSGTAASASAA
jgi:uncharacterized membrane protein YraQ (UPF0718 family)